MNRVSQATAQATTATKSRRNKWLLVALTPCLVLAVGGGWLVATTSGLQWLSGLAEQRSGESLSVEGISGSLFNSFGMLQLVVRGDGWRVTLRGVQLQWQPAALLRGELRVSSLSAQQVEVLSLPSDTPLTLPDTLRLPLAVNVLQIKIDSLGVFSRESVPPDFLANDVAAGFISNDRHHRVQVLRARLSYGDLAGTGEIAADPPYALKAQATLDAAMSFFRQPERAHLVADAVGDLQHIAVKLNGNGVGMSVNGTAQLAPLSVIPVSRLQIAFSGMNTARLFDAAPSALVSGSVDLHGTPGGGLEGAVQVRNTHAAALNHNGLPLLGVTAQLRLSSSTWQLQQLNARLQNDGHVSGAASWQVQRGKLSAQLKVHQLDPAAWDTRLPSAALQGDIALDALGDQVNLSSVRLTRGETTLTGQGQLVLDRRRHFRFNSQLRKLNLSEFAAIAPTDLNAGLEVSGTFLPKVSGTLQLNLTDSHFGQSDISGKGHLEFTGMRHATGEAEVRLGDNQLNLIIARGTDADRAQLRLDAPKLEQLGSGLSGQLAGNANLSGNFSGSFVEPRLQFSAQGSLLALPDGQYIAALDTTGDLALGKLTSGALQLKLAVTDYRGSGELSLPKASVEVQGSRVQHTVRASARLAQSGNELGELTLQASGGLSDPAQGWQALQWRGTLDELAAQGVLPFHLLTAAPLTLARNSFHLGTADVAVSGGQIQFSDTQWTPQRGHSAGHFSGLNVRAMNMQQNKLVSEAIDPMRFGGAWEVTADEHWQGQLQVQHESGDWVVDGNTGLRLGLRGMQLTLSAQQDQLQARLDASGERLGEVAMQASMPLTHSDTGWTILPDAPLAGHLRLHSDDLSWLAPLLDSNLQSGGRLNFDADLIGTLQSPRLQGVAQGDALSFSLLDQGIRLEQGELKARFESAAVHVDRFVFSAPYLPRPRDELLAAYRLPAGVGKLSASGRIDLDGGKDSGKDSSSGGLQITAERLPLAQRADRWIIASGTGRVRYVNKTLLLDGNVRADAGLINQPTSNLPRWSEDVQISGQEVVTRPGPPSAVDATLDLGDQFYIRASGLEGRLTGQFKVRGDPGEPLRVTGIISTQDGLFEAYGQRLQVERGILNFQGALDDPGLNILALRKGLDVEAGVEVTGTARRPTVRLVSVPNVPDGEKLSWIILGRVPESNDVDAFLLLSATGTILGGQSITKFGQTIGVDELYLSQQAGADSQQTQKVTVAKRLSARSRISYEQGLSEVGGVAKFTYTLTPRITLVTRTGIEDALDLFYTFRFY